MISTGKVIGFQYVLTNAKGEEIDRSTEENPFEYLHGKNQIVPGLERELEGRKIGDKLKVVVKPADGYGDLNPELRIEVDRSAFPKDSPLSVGMQFQADSPEGPVVFTVKELNGDKVTVDGNHPLAGVTLHFDVEVTSVRDATAEELAHGHAHGPDGHHHH